MSEKTAQILGLSRRQALLAGVAAVAVAGVAVAAFVVARRDGDPAPAPRARQYRDFTACLLTDGQGITGAAAAPVWAGLRDASASTRARVRYATVAGEQTPQNAAMFLAGLAQGRCEVILAAGAAPTGAAGTVAKQFPKSRFVVVDAKASGGNVSSLEAAKPGGLRAAVRALVEKAVRERARD